MGATDLCWIEQEFGDIIPIIKNKYTVSLQ